MVVVSGWEGGGGGVHLSVRLVETVPNLWERLDLTWHLSQRFMRCSVFFIES